MHSVNCHRNSILAGPILAATLLVGSANEAVSNGIGAPVPPELWDYAIKNVFQEMGLRVIFDDPDECIDHGVKAKISNGVQEVKTKFHNRFGLTLWDRMPEKGPTRYLLTVKFSARKFPINNGYICVFFALSVQEMYLFKKYFESGPRGELEARVGIYRGNDYKNDSRIKMKRYQEKKIEENNPHEFDVTYSFNGNNSLSNKFLLSKFEEAESRIHQVSFGGSIYRLKEFKRIEMNRFRENPGRMAGLAFRCLGGPLYYRNFFNLFCITSNILTAAWREYTEKIPRRYGDVIKFYMDNPVSILDIQEWMKIYKISRSELRNSFYSENDRTLPRNRAGSRVRTH